MLELMMTASLLLMGSHTEVSQSARAIVEADQRVAFTGSGSGGGASSGSSGIGTGREQRPGEPPEGMTGSGNLGSSPGGNVGMGGGPFDSIDLQGRESESSRSSRSNAGTGIRPDPGQMQPPAGMRGSGNLGSSPGGNPGVGGGSSGSTGGGGGGR
jgi:hypothetical protein